MTPDGISDIDWARVHELAVEIGNAEGNASHTYTSELLGYLTTLEQKYGPLPSILTTRADYAGDPRESAALLTRAYRVAAERHDREATLYIASSLAALQIAEFRDRREGARWLAAFADALKHAGDEFDREDFQELEIALEAL